MNLTEIMKKSKEKLLLSEKQEKESVKEEWCDRILFHGTETINPDSFELLFPDEVTGKMIYGDNYNPNIGIFQCNYVSKGNKCPYKNSVMVLYTNYETGIIGVCKTRGRVAK